MKALKPTLAEGIHVGMAGWTYQPWRGAFYPKGLRQADELAFASRQLNSIEVNGTFYGLLKPASFQAWHDATPEDFVFSLKAPKFITHIRRLREVEQPVANFFASGIFALGKKLGPVLWQLPPSLVFDADTLGAFLALLPHTLAEAEALAVRHDEKVEGRALTKPMPGTRIRHALEVRHKSFLDPTLMPMLRKHNVAVVIADTTGEWPQIEQLTADVAYLRLHGEGDRYAKGYPGAALDRWAEKIRGWHGPKAGQATEIFAYFDTEAKEHSPSDALKLSQRLGIEVGDVRKAKWALPSAEVSKETKAKTKARPKKKPSR